MKTKPSIDIDEMDFGFSAVSEEELREMERKLQEKTVLQETHIKQISKTHEEKLETLYKLIMPLLVNLQKNPDKDYIYWPSRAEKVQEFIKKVDKLIYD